MKINPSVQKHNQYRLLVHRQQCRLYTTHRTESVYLLNNFLLHTLGTSFPANHWQSSPINNDILPHHFPKQAHLNMCYLSVGAGYTTGRYLTSRLKFALHPRREYSCHQRSGIRL